jgi:hypothetical protein
MVLLILGLVGMWIGLAAAVPSWLMLVLGWAHGATAMIILVRIVDPGWIDDPP